MPLDFYDTWRIESAIAAGARKAANASYAAAGSTDRLNKTVEGLREDISGLDSKVGGLKDEVTVFRTGMLDAMGSLGADVRRAGTEIVNGIIRVERQALASDQKLSQLLSSVEVGNANMIAGFEQVIDRLDKIQSTLERIESGVLNPEETRALERYRRARNLLSRGRVVEALETVEAAMANHPGPSLAHMPELRFLRGAIRLGASHGGKSAVPINPAGAAEDFEEALEFCTAEAQPEILANLAFAQWLNGDILRALHSYEALPRPHTGNVLLQKGRCLLRLNQLDAAARILIELAEEGEAGQLAIAADPVCAEYGSDLARRFRVHEERKAEARRRREAEERERLAAERRRKDEERARREARLATFRKNLEVAQKFDPDKILLTHDRLRSEAEALIDDTSDFVEAAQREFDASTGLSDLRFSVSFTSFEPGRGSGLRRADIRGQLKKLDRRWPGIEKLSEPLNAEDDGFDGKVSAYLETTREVLQWAAAAMDYYLQQFDEKDRLRHKMTVSAHIDIPGTERIAETRPDSWLGGKRWDRQVRRFEERKEKRVEELKPEKARHFHTFRKEFLRLYDQDRAERTREVAKELRAYRARLDRLLAKYIEPALRG